jgi:hypothetical protein
MSLGLYGTHAPNNGRRALRHLKQYLEREGHCRVPAKHISDSFEAKHAVNAPPLKSRPLQHSMLNHRCLPRKFQQSSGHPLFPSHAQRRKI